MSLAITNVVTISVAAAPTGIANYRINNLAYFTKEEPLAPLSGDYAIYLTPQDVATDFGTNSETYAAAVAIFSQSPNILTGGGSLIVVPMAAEDTLVTTLEDVGEQIFFGGVCYGGYAPDDAELLAAAEAFQAAKKLLFVSQHLTSSMSGGAIFDDIQSASLTYTRCLLYTVSAVAARKMAAAYAGRGMSTAFDGSNTAQNMNLKQLVGITADPGITQTIFNTAQTVGVDVYTEVAGRASVMSSGANAFFDQVYNLLWFVFGLEVAGFNALATTRTKVPQTELGIAALRNAYLGVCKQAVTNGYVAPGTWNSPDRFGDPEDFDRNIQEYGFYVYSAPLSQQSQADRADRKAPLIQIAIKEAGAVNTTSVLVFIEA